MTSLSYLNRTVKAGKESVESCTGSVGIFVVADDALAIAAFAEVGSGHPADTEFGVNCVKIIEGNGAGFATFVEDIVSASLLVDACDAVFVFAYEGVEAASGLADLEQDGE